ncbi:MAG: hypothetical protein KJ852_10375 [Gammaproteobacteria bacterium]|nr:hypothetical protein [Gammaproteobacteria bacterium]MBU0785839.1 hypothetical protein [Gammaproteobacteria bacterium]MBU0815810.1 hypothetical protein [Gammaproteobacteria bacterium]MBU1787349.1 hypothetical protein [Gammaproteobacteria bacterium]
MNKPSSAPWLKRIALATALGLLLTLAGYLFLGKTGLGKDDIYRFEGVAGPNEPSLVQPAVPTAWTQFDQGGKERLAILLTDPDSSWLGLAHGLKTIGVPFRITRDYRQAIQHKAILVYPTISGGSLEPEALRVLAEFARERGTLIGSHVVGGGMNELFGFEAAVAAKHTEIRFDTSQPLAAGFTDPKEIHIPVGNPARPDLLVGTYGYTNPRNPPLAVFEDGSAAVTQKTFAKGRAYALGMDLGFLLLKGYNNREEGIARSYVNDFEPSLDVLLRLVKNIYLEANPQAVTLSTVPAGKSLAVVISHDIDYTRSMKNAVSYAGFEKSQGIPATHFIQVKYIKDWNDDIFFNAQGVLYLKELQRLGVEIGSHSIAHSQSMDKFPIGTGTEQYPDYQPFVKKQLATENGTLLGELRVSKFLLDHFTPGSSVVSFRPGHLRNPYSMPQLLQATGYRYSSSVTANNSLTHLPFQLNYNRNVKSELEVFEFPVTVEDEASPKLGDRLGSAIALSKKISRYGGMFMVLIHTDVLDHKFEFERGFVEAVRPYSWFGSLREFGDWWSARNKVECDLEDNGRTISLMLPSTITGLTVSIPAGLQLASVTPAGLAATQVGKHIVLGSAKGPVKLLLQGGN